MAAADRWRRARPIVERQVEHEQLDQRVDRSRVVQAPQIERQIFAKVELPVWQGPAERRQHRIARESMRLQEVAERRYGVAILDAEWAREGVGKCAQPCHLAQGIRGGGGPVRQRDRSSAFRKECGGCYLRSDEGRATIGGTHS